MINNKLYVGSVNASNQSTIQMFKNSSNIQTLFKQMSNDAAVPARTRFVTGGTTMNHNNAAKLVIVCIDENWNTKRIGLTL